MHASRSREQARKIRQLFDAVVELAPEERAAALEQRCRGDAALRREVEALLEAHEQADEVLGGLEQPAAAAADPLVGRQVAHFHIESRLGGGGMGVVYRAEDTRLKRPVALKFLPRAWTRDREARARFLLEAQAASALDHPHICTVYDVGETEDGRLFLAMACYEGETLREIVERGRLPVEEAVEYACQVADALQAAHAKGIVHRDVKPANVMVLPASGGTGPAGHVKLLDFGLARLVGEVHLTQAGATMGTTAYMSPEQLRGEEVDARTDLWSFGVVLHEMLTGEHPFDAVYEQAVAYAILNADPPPVRSLRPEVPAALEQVVGRLLRKHASERYPHAHEVLGDLQSIRAGAYAPARPEGRSSIAVLPFENMSADPGQEYFCDGLAEELINALTQLGDLRVVARTSAFAFKGRHEDVREIGRKLGVATVLEGSVRRAGNRLRITAQLIDVADGYHLWSERFDRVMEDVFAVQDEISLAIADQLKVDLLEAEKTALVKRHTENVEAYRLYLKGRYFWNQRTEQALEKALSYFEQAIAVDPLYALAHVGVADCYIMLGGWSFVRATEASTKARTAAAKALEIDDALADGQVSLGLWNMFFNWDWPAAERHFNRAFELNLQHVQARHAYGVFLTLTSRFDEALGQMNRALELDPLSLPVNTFLGMALAYAGRYDEAADVLSKVLEMAPDYFPAHWVLGVSRASEAEYDEACAAFRKAVALTQEAPHMIGHLGYAYAMAGRREEALEMLDRLGALSAERYVSPCSRVLVRAGLGETEEALAALEGACREGDPYMVHVRVTPLLDSLRAEPRFAAVMDRVRART